MSRLRELVIPAAILHWLDTELVASDQTEDAARGQARRRHEAELQQCQRRLDLMFEDRLDGRVGAALYDPES